MAQSTDASLPTGTTYLTGTSGTITSPNYPVTSANNYQHTKSVTTDSGTTSGMITSPNYPMNSTNNYQHIGSITTDSGTTSDTTTSPNYPMTSNNYQDTGSITTDSGTTTDTITSPNYPMTSTNYQHTGSITTDSGTTTDTTTSPNYPMTSANNYQHTGSITTDSGTTSDTTTNPNYLMTSASNYQHTESITTDSGTTSDTTTTPNYPMNTDNNFKHTWSITTGTTSTKFTVNDFKTEECNDYVQIYETQRGTSTHKLCGLRIPHSVTINGKYAKFHFYTDSSYTRKVVIGGSAGGFILLVSVISAIAFYLVRRSRARSRQRAAVPTSHSPQSSIQHVGGPSLPYHSIQGYENKAFNEGPGGMFNHDTASIDMTATTPSGSFLMPPPMQFHDNNHKGQQHN